MLRSGAGFFEQQRVMLLLVLVFMVLGHALQCVWLAGSMCCGASQALSVCFFDCHIGAVCCHRHCNRTAGSIVHSGLHFYLSMSCTSRLAGVCVALVFWRS